MLQEVKTGEKILASQYNELIRAVRGPIDPSSQTPFTQTANGSLFNGGHTSYQTKASSRFNDFMSLTYSTGTLNDLYDGWEEDSENRFDGIWFQIPSAQKNKQYFYHSQFFDSPVYVFLIDPSSNGQFHLLWLQPDSEQDQSGMFPLCRIDESAALGVFQILECSQTNSPYLGQTIAIFGNWKKLNPGGDGWDVTSAVRSNKSALEQAIKDAHPALRSQLSKIRFLSEYTMFDNFDELEETKIDMPPVAFTIGQQLVESLPDAAQEHEQELSCAELSSLEFTPSNSWGWPDTVPVTFTYSLFNFSKLSVETNMFNEIYDIDPTQLSSWDILVRRKQRHSKSDDNPNCDGQCSAYLDYVPLSGFIVCDSEIDAIKMESDTQCSSVQHNGTDSSLQIFKFDDPTVIEVDEESKSDYDIVLRDHSGAQSKVNYMSLSDLCGGGGAEISVDSQYSNLSSIGYDANGYLEIFNFSQGQRVEKDDKFDIIVRDNENGKVDYTPLSALGSGYPGPWEITIDEDTGDATFTNCVAKVARAYHFFADQSANVGGGDKMVYFVMTHTTSPSVHMYVGNYSSAASLLGGSDANCISASITPLYRVTDNKVTCDFRYMLNIQAYDNRNFSSTMYY